MEYELTPNEEQAKRRVCFALDTQSPATALRWSIELSDLVGTVKVGKELHTASCNEGVPILNLIDDTGGRMFLDLKLHDTPATVYGAAKAAAYRGVEMFNIHIGGGEKMCKEALRGAYEGSELRGIPTPQVIGVTVLTSLDDSDLQAQGINTSYDDLVRRRTEQAREWELDGIVCPAKKAGALEQEFGQWLYVTPGIQWGGKAGEGQKQLYTPDQAVEDCKSSVLVIGSAIRKADDKRATAYEILQAMAKKL